MNENTAAAAASRRTAERLRAEAQGLQFAARRAVDRSRETSRSCVATYEGSRSRPVLVGSPWSALPWALPSKELLLELEHVLDVV